MEIQKSQSLENQNKESAEQEPLENWRKIFDQNRLLIGLALIILIFVFGGIVLASNSRGKDEIKIISSEDLVPEENIVKDIKEELIVFDIEGGVKNPGVYRLENGSVIVDAINAAGGFSFDADRERVAREINQASPIGQNSKIYIFTLSDREARVVTNIEINNSQSVNSNLSSQSSLININTASLSELDTLPKIGPVTAQNIIDWREQNGGFIILEDIKKVKGIGDSLYSGIEDMISVE